MDWYTILGLSSTQSIALELGKGLVCIVTGRNALDTCFYKRRQYRY